MNPEKYPSENLDADILQCKADILRALQQVSQGGKLRETKPISGEQPSQKSDFTVSPGSNATSRNLIQDNNYPVGARILSFDQLQRASDQKKDDTRETFTAPTKKSEIEDALNQDISENNIRITELNIQIQELEKQLSDERRQTQEVTAELTALRLQAEQTGEQLKRLQAEIEERKTAYEYFLVQNKDIQNALSSQNTAIQAELDQKNSAFQAAQNRIHEIQAQLAAREQDIQDQKAALDSALGQLNEKQLLLEQAQTTLQTHQQQTQSQSDVSALLEQKERQIEQLKFEQIEHYELHQREKTGLETKIVSLEQLAEQLKQENYSQSQELAEIRKALSDLEHVLNQNRRELEAVHLEKTALASAIADIESQSRQQQEALNTLRMQNETLTTQNQEALSQLETARSELTQQSSLSEESIRQLKLRIAELEDQIAETGEQSEHKTSELLHLIDEQKQLLEKTEHQRRELENRMAALQAENDRLCAAGNEVVQLQDKIRITEQRLENTGRQLERLTGDHQLLGEENNQLHSMLYLRDHELEKLQAQIQQLQERLSILEQADLSQPALEHSAADMGAEQPEGMVFSIEEPSSSETEECVTESESGIPSFNLADQIMAEHRRSVASQRQSPGTRSQSARENAISRVVGQFVKTPDTPEPDTTQTGPSMSSEPVSETPELQITHPISGRFSESGPSDVLFAEIVKRDILRFLDKKQKTMQRPPWSWNHN